MRFRTLSLLSLLSLLLVPHESRADDVWDFCDSNWFTSRGYSFPFEPGAYDGVNLAMSCSDEYQKDWEIYDVSLGNIRAQVPPPSGNHYFALYQPALGVLRTFFFVEANKAPEGQRHSLNLVVHDGGVPFTQHAYFNYSGEEGSFLLGESAIANQNPPAFFINSPRSPKWLISDVYLSYDPTHYRTAFPGRALAFSYTVKTHEQTEISLNGRIDPIAGSSNIRLFSAGKAAAEAAYSGYKMAPTQIADGIAEVGTYVGRRGKYYVDLGNSLGQLATAVAKNPEQAAATMGASNLISSFILSPSGSPSIGFPPSTISLTGASTKVSPLFQAEIPLASSDLFLSRPAPDYTLNNPHPEEQVLGQHNVLSPPTATVYIVRRVAKSGTPGMFRKAYDAYLDINDLKCQLIVNPVSGAKVKKVEVRIADINLTRGFRELGFTSWDREPNSFGGPMKWIRAPSGFYDTDNTLLLGRIWPDTWVERSYSQMNTLPEPTKLIDRIRVRAIYTFQVSPTRTMEVLKNFDLVLKHANTPNPVFTGKTWFLPIGSLQSSVPSATIANAHQTCPYKDPVTTIYIDPSEKVSLSYGGRANWHAWSSGAPAYSAVRPVAVSGYIGPNEEAAMIFRFTGIYFSFLWRTSSELNWDVLSLYVDGETIPQAQISGETDWEYQQRDMEYGPHEVKIVYKKDATVRAGQDRGFVTNFLVDTLD